MSLFDNLGIALDGIRTNKMRSILTMLGIIIGVAAVIIMISLGQGASKQVSDQISSMGSNLLMIMPGADSGTMRGAAGNVQTLTTDDATAISKLQGVKYVAPQVSAGSGSISHGSNTWTTSVTGVTPAMQKIKSFTLSSGSFITSDDINNNSQVAVLGSTTAEELFTDGTSPVGQTIRINSLAFTVVGVLNSKGGSSSGSDQDDVIYIPISSAQKRLAGVDYISMINVEADSEKDLDYVQSSIESLLRDRHGLSGSDENDFKVNNMTSVLETQESTSAIMTWLLAGVAGVSLIVGGIGIMNIMLVSVTERTREIGLRMAIGATEGDIRNQFMVEALLLCLLGAFIGIVLGFVGSKLISTLAGWATSVSAVSIMVSSGFSAAIGIFFGYYPAKKAAALDPIEALRYE